MLSKKLEIFSRHNSSLATAVGKLDSYIHWLRKENVHEVIPRVAKVELNLSEADTLGLLSVFQDAEIVRPRYDLVCRRTGEILGSYSSIDEIPNEIDCAGCSRMHNADELRIDLVFEIAQSRAADAA